MGEKVTALETLQIPGLWTQTDPPQPAPCAAVLLCCTDRCVWGAPYVAECAFSETV